MAPRFSSRTAAAKRTGESPESTAIAAVATVGYSAFLFAPPAIGLIAEQFTLRGSFVLLLVALIALGALAQSVAAQPCPPS